MAVHRRVGDQDVAAAVVVQREVALEIMADQRQIGGVRAVGDVERAFDTVAGRRPCRRLVGEGDVGEINRLRGVGAEAEDSPDVVFRVVQDQFALRTGGKGDVLEVGDRLEVQNAIGAGDLRPAEAGDRSVDFHRAVVGNDVTIVEDGAGDPQAAGARRLDKAVVDDVVVAGVDDQLVRAVGVDGAGEVVVQDEVVGVADGAGAGDGVVDILEELAVIAAAGELGRGAIDRLSRPAGDDRGYEGVVPDIARLNDADEIGRGRRLDAVRRQRQVEVDFVGEFLRQRRQRIGVGGGHGFGDVERQAVGEVDAEHVAGRDRAAERQKVGGVGDGHALVGVDQIVAVVAHHDLAVAGKTAADVEHGLLAGRVDIDRAEIEDMRRQVQARVIGDVDGAGIVQIGGAIRRFRHRGDRAAGHREHAPAAEGYAVIKCNGRPGDCGFDDAAMDEAADGHRSGFTGVDHHAGGALIDIAIDLQTAGAGHLDQPVVGRVGIGIDDERMSFAAGIYDAVVSVVYYEVTVAELAAAAYDVIDVRESLVGAAALDGVERAVGHRDLAAAGDDGAVGAADRQFGRLGRPHERDGAAVDDRFDRGDAAQRDDGGVADRHGAGVFHGPIDEN